MLTAKTFFFRDKMKLKHSYIIYDCAEHLESITTWLDRIKVQYEITIEGGDTALEFFGNSGQEVDEVLNQIRGRLQNVTILAI